MVDLLYFFIKNCSNDENFIAFPGKSEQLFATEYVNHSPLEWPSQSDVCE